jgi:DNA (cytosine-5)-methyltransferase 1
MSWGENTTEKEPILEAFCGPGGLGYGFSQFFDVAYAIDESSPAVRTYKANHPNTQVRRQDIRNLTGARGDFFGVAGVIGGPPCQGHSAMSTKTRAERLEDPRNSLGLQFMRLVDEINPHFFVLENVPSADENRKQQIITSAKSLGYNVVSARLNSADFGSAQARHRWIVIGTKGFTNPLPFIQPARTHKTVRDALNGITNNWGFMKSRPDTLQKLTCARSDKWISISNGYDNAIKLQWDTQAPAITNVKKVYFVHPDEVRNITLAEAAALQGFPPDYVWAGTEREIGQMIANAMPTEFARHLAGALEQPLSQGCA